MHDQAGLVTRASLTAQDNVFRSALEVAECWGYRVNVSLDFDENETWHAEKEDFDFFASNPIELLGVIAIHRALEPKAAKPYWWQSQEKDDRWATHLKAAEQRLDTLRCLIADSRFRERLRSELVKQGGGRVSAAAALGLSIHEIDMILDLPGFGGLED